MSSTKRIQMNFGQVRDIIVELDKIRTSNDKEEKTDTGQPNKSRFGFDDREAKAAADFLVNLGLLKDTRSSLTFGELDDFYGDVWWALESHCRYYVKQQKDTPPSQPASVNVVLGAIAMCQATGSAFELLIVNKPMLFQLLAIRPLRDSAPLPPSAPTEAPDAGLPTLPPEKTVKSER